MPEVEGTIDDPVLIVKPDFDGLHFFGLQMRISTIPLNLIIHLRERWHAERRVIRGMELPVLMGTVAQVDAWIDGEVHITPRVLDGHQSCREGEVLEQQVVFEIAADVRPVQAEGVVAVGAADVVRSGEGFTEVAADEVFVTYLRTEGCSSCCPVEIAVQVDAVDVGVVVVILYLLW